MIRYERRLNQCPLNLPSNPFDNQAITTDVKFQILPYFLLFLLIIPSPTLLLFPLLLVFPMDLSIRYYVLSRDAVISSDIPILS